MKELAELLAQVVEKARSEKMVVSRQTRDGMTLLVYPLEDGLLVALGYGPDLGRRVVAESVLRKRSQDLERYGAWLPAQLADGSWYLVRRLPDNVYSGSSPLLSNDELMVARELLS